MSLRHLFFTLALLMLANPVLAICKLGATAQCTVSGKPGTRVCLGSGHFGPCQASPQTGITVVVPLPANYIGEVNDTATIRSDSDVFWSLHFNVTDDQEAATINGYFTTDGGGAPFWLIDQDTSALVKMYDLLAPLDQARAGKYLERLRRIAAALLANRDDFRQVTGFAASGGHPVDFFRKRTMAAWGAFTDDRDGEWNTDVSTSALFTYAMAAFARRVADNPALYPQYTADAVRFTTAALQTYAAFAPEQHLTPQDPWAYFTVPRGYSKLHCPAGKTQESCQFYRDTAGQPLAYNESLSMMKALAEAALASNSALYRASTDASAYNLSLGTGTAPLLIAKDVTYYDKDKHLHPLRLYDGTYIFDKWSQQQPGPYNPQNIQHGGFEIGALAVILDDKIRLNALLAKNGQSVQVALSTPLFVRFANTFLRKMWHYDFQNANGIRNVLSTDVDGGGYLGLDQKKSANLECAGWLPLAQFDRWMWIRCRDATFHAPGFLRVDNHAALLRYRQFLTGTP